MGFFAHFREVYEQRAWRESLGLVARLPMHAASNHTAKKAAGSLKHIRTKVAIIYILEPFSIHEKEALENYCQSSLESS